MSLDRIGNDESGENMEAPAPGGTDAVSDTETGVPSKSVRRWLILLLCALLFICSQFLRVSNAIIAPMLKEDLALSSESLGVLSAMFFYVFAAAQIPIGICLDRFGSRRTMTVLSVIGTIGVLVFASAKGMYEAMIGRALLGLGMAANLMGSLKLFTSWFSPKEFATITGLIFSLGTLGNMLATTPLALLVEAGGWRFAFYIIGGLTGVITLLFYVFVSDGPEGSSSSATPATESKDKPSPWTVLKDLFHRREYWLISFSTFFRYGTFVAIQGLWAGPYLMEALGYSTVSAGNLLLLINLGVIIGSPVGGWLSDRVLNSRKWVVVIGLFMLGIGELGLALGWGEAGAWTVGCLLLFLGFFSSFGLVMFAHIKETMPSEMTGVSLTGVNLFTMLGAAVYLQGMGKVLDLSGSAGQGGTEGYGTAFLLGFFGVAVAFVCYSCTREKSKKPSRNRLAA